MVFCDVTAAAASDNAGQIVMTKINTNPALTLNPLDPKPETLNTP